MPQSTSDLNANLGTLGDLRQEGLIFSQQVNPLNTLSDIAMSTDTLRMARDADPEREEHSDLGEYRGLFDVSPRNESTVISLTVEGSSPELALERTNLMIDSFLGRIDELRLNHSEFRAEQLQDELVQAEANLNQAQLNLADYQVGTNLINGEEQTNQIVETIAELTTTRASAVARAQASQSQAGELLASMGLTAEQALQLLSSNNNPTFQRLRERLAEIETSLQQVEGRFLASSPTVRALEQERENVLARLSDYIPDGGDISSNGNRENFLDRGDSLELLQTFIIASSEASAQQKEADALQQEIDRLNETLKAIPASQARLNDLHQRVAVAEGVYNGLVAQVEETKLSGNGIYPVVQVLGLPYVDPDRAGPSRRLMALGGLVASVLGSAALLSFFEGRNPLLAVQDLQTSEIPVLKAVPKLDVLLENRQLSLLKSAPEFQLLASDIESFSLDNKYVMVTSSDAGEGKTSTVLGLAMALASLGSRVLLVDGDFHRGELSHKLGFPWSNSERLNPSSLLDIDVKPVSIDVGLDLVVSYPLDRNPTQFVVQGEFSEYVQLAEAQGTYDYVLVDGAPIGLTSDAVLMAREVGNVLMVVRPGSSNLHPFRNSVEQLQRYGTNILGIVVNGKVTNSTDYIYGRQLPERIPS
ncbi:MAG: GumC family protein [Synechococcus sp.]